MSAGIIRLDNLAKLDPTTHPAMPMETQATAKFLKLINDWFNIMNFHKPIHDDRHTRRAYGYPGSLSTQMDILIETHNTMINTRHAGSLLPWQKGVLQNTITLMHLFNHMRKTTDLEFLLTCCFNQDEIQ